jgi:hypothetical protein
MSYLKSLSFIAAGAVLALLFAFKNEEAKKEFAVIETLGYSCRIITGAGAPREIDMKRQSEYSPGLVKVLNEMSSEGWKVTAAVFNPQHTRHYIYLERNR